jgi:hypothetical protein
MTLDRTNPRYEDTLTGAIASLRLLIDELNETINFIAKRRAAPPVDLSLRSIMNEIVHGLVRQR